MKFVAHPRWWLIVGLVLMIAGAIDPLEGSVVILLGSAVATVGGFAARAKRRRLQSWAFALTLIGVALLFGMSALGGVGGSTGRSMWWLLILLPYPVGWILGLVAVGSMLRQRSREAAA